MPENIKTQTDSNRLKPTQTDSNRLKPLFLFETKVQLAQCHWSLQAAVSVHVVFPLPSPQDPDDPDFFSNGSHHQRIDLPRFHGKCHVWRNQHHVWTQGKGLMSWNKVGIKSVDLGIKSAANPLEIVFNTFEYLPLVWFRKRCQSFGTHLFSIETHDILLGTQAHSEQMKEHVTEKSLPSRSVVQREAKTLTDFEHHWPLNFS